MVKKIKEAPKTSEPAKIVFNIDSPIQKETEKNQAMIGKNTVIGKIDKNPNFRDDEINLSDLEDEE